MPIGTEVKDKVETPIQKFTLGLIDLLITIGTLTTGGSGPVMLSKAPPTTLNTVKNIIKEGVESTKPALKELKYQLKKGLDLDW